MSLTYDPIPDETIAEPGLGEALFAMGARVPFARGEEIFGPGEAADLIYLIVSGAVRFTRYMGSYMGGGHVELGVLSGPGDLFGLCVGAGEHRASAEALEDSVILVASRRGLALVLGEAGLDALLDCGRDAPARLN